MKIDRQPTSSTIVCFIGGYKLDTTNLIDEKQNSAGQPTIADKLSCVYCSSINR